MRRNRHGVSTILRYRMGSAMASIADKRYVSLVPARNSSTIVTPPMITAVPRSGCLSKSSIKTPQTRSGGRKPRRKSST